MGKGLSSGSPRAALVVLAPIVHLATIRRPKNGQKCTGKSSRWDHVAWRSHDSRHHMWSPHLWSLEPSPVADSNLPPCARPGSPNPLSVDLPKRLHDSNLRDATGRKKRAGWAVPSFMRRGSFPNARNDATSTQVGVAGVAVSS